MINHEQREVTNKIIKRYLCGLRRYPPVVTIKLLDIILIIGEKLRRHVYVKDVPVIGKQTEILFIQFGVIDTFQFLQSLLTHPYPQNRKSGNAYVAQEVGMAVYKDHYGQLAKEPQGILDLTPLNDSPNSDLDVKRNDVVLIVIEMVSESLEIEKERLRILANQCSELECFRKNASERMKSHQARLQTLDSRKIIEINHLDSGVVPIADTLFEIVKKILFSNDTSQKLFLSFKSVYNLVNPEQEQQLLNYFDIGLFGVDIQSCQSGELKNQILSYVLCHLKNSKRFYDAHKDVDIFISIGHLSNEKVKLVSNYIRGVIFHKQGYYQQALEILSNMSKKHSSFVPALLECASIKVKINDVDGALQDYDAAIKLIPEYADAYADVGYLYISPLVSNPTRPHHTMKALAYFEMCVGMDPNNQRGRDGLDSLPVSKKPIIQLVTQDKTIKLEEQRMGATTDVDVKSAALDEPSIASIMAQRQTNALGPQHD
ncbi:hypothetical protein AKO1_012947 [Acrasis kona]|uniref:Uncharacterized protein n=1 Tax=Acrasis kona TaxID=1008807 RepID=A0AAW2Z115_9EUKA